MHCPAVSAQHQHIKSPKQRSAAGAALLHRMTPYHIPIVHPAADVVSSQPPPQQQQQFHHRHRQHQHQHQHQIATHFAAPQHHPAICHCSSGGAASTPPSPPPPTMMLLPAAAPTYPCWTPGDAASALYVPQVAVAGGAAATHSLMYVPIGLAGGMVPPLVQQASHHQATVGSPLQSPHRLTAAGVMHRAPPYVVGTSVANVAQQQQQQQHGRAVYRTLCHRQEPSMQQLPQHNPDDLTAPDAGNQQNDTPFCKTSVAIDQMPTDNCGPIRTIIPKTDTTSHYHIFVGDLSSEVDTEMLRAAFQSFGDISDCRVVRDQYTHNSKGYGFVSYRSQTEATTALQTMNNQRVGARAIRTNWATRKPPATRIDRSTTAPRSTLSFDTVYNQSAPTNSTVYCGATNGALAGVLSESMLHDLFDAYGRIEEMRLFAEKGFAFVRFAEKRAAAQAIVAVHNTELNGRPLKCAWGRETGDPTHIAASLLAAQTQAAMGSMYAHDAAIWMMQADAQRGHHQFQQAQQHQSVSTSPSQELALQIPFVSGSDLGF